MTDDSYFEGHSLDRFVLAQAGEYARALSELEEGAKRSHWMWFIFPQYVGLGVSGMSRRYAIHSLAEAASYLAHPILGSRLEQCARVLLRHKDRTAFQIFGLDDVKLCSSMTLFELVSPTLSVYSEVLDTICRSSRDLLTLKLVDSEARY